MKISFKSIAVASVQALASAAILNIIIFQVGVVTDTIDLELPISPQGDPLSLIPVVIASIIPVIFAGLIYWALTRFTGKAWTIFRVLAIVILLGSFYMPFNVPDMPVGMAVTLNVMHLVVFGAVMFFYSKATRKAIT